MRSVRERGKEYSLLVVPPGRAGSNSLKGRDGKEVKRFCANYGVDLASSHMCGVHISRQAPLHGKIDVRERVRVFVGSPVLIDAFYVRSRCRVQYCCNQRR
jgi:hypothetical protein